MDSIEPNIPPLEMVKVPPVMSSSVSLPSRAFQPIFADLIFDLRQAQRIASRITGTTRPRS